MHKKNYEGYRVFSDTGGYITTLNANLLSKQGLGYETVLKIKEKHIERAALIKKMERAKKPSTWKKHAGAITQIDFKLQALWGFSQDENFHYWWRVPHCLCASLDNLDRYGTPYRVVNSVCPVHGDEQ